mgnify:CR=1 FL=1
MDQDALKKQVAEAALRFVPEGEIIGVGTGSTANFFIDGLASLKDRIKGAVASSDATAERLKQHGIEVISLNDVGNLSVYVDGADEVNSHREMIKGGGGALTREKIVAAAAREFICIVDASKQVKRLGAFPLPVEVIPMARSYVARKLVALGGQPEYREGFVTDTAISFWTSTTWTSPTRLNWKPRSTILSASSPMACSPSGLPTWCW